MEKARDENGKMERHANEHEKKWKEMAIERNGNGKK